MAALCAPRIARAARPRFQLPLFPLATQARLESYKSAKEAKSTDEIKASLDAKMTKASQKHEEIIKSKVERCVGCGARAPPRRRRPLTDPAPRSPAPPPPPPPPFPFPRSAHAEIARATAAGAAAQAAQENAGGAAAQ